MKRFVVTLGEDKNLRVRNGMLEASYGFMLRNLEVLPYGCWIIADHRLARSEAKRSSDW